MVLSLVCCVLCSCWPFADEQHSQYSKLLLASKEQVLCRVVQEEKIALEQQLAEEKHTPESCFIEAAIQELKVRYALDTGWDGEDESLQPHIHAR